MSTTKVVNASTAQRLLDAAMVLFSEKGFAATTVGQVESTAGFSPRSGVLYKYFDSKSALLDACLEQHLLALSEIRDSLGLLPLGDLRSELTLVGHWLMTELENQRALTHVLERDGGRVPNIRDRMREGVSDQGYRIGAEFVKRWRPDLSGLQTQALSVLVVGALINVKRSTWTYESAPLGLDTEVIIVNWVDMCFSYLSDGAT